MSKSYIKTNRVFTPLRKYGWIFTLTVAIGGLWLPYLGLAVIPVMIGLISVSFFSGRYWCGNICPHGSLFDSLIYPLTGNRRFPKLLKSKVFGLVFLAFFSYRLVSRVLVVSSFWGTLRFWERLGFIFVTTYLMVTIVGSLAGIFISSRTWCNFCPMGTLQKMSNKLGTSLGIARKTEKKVTVDHSACVSCGKCSRVCPMQLDVHTNFSEKGHFEHADCLKCTTCVVSCPTKALDMFTSPEAASRIQSA